MDALPPQGSINGQRQLMNAFLASAVYQGKSDIAKRYEAAFLVYDTTCSQFGWEREKALKSPLSDSGVTEEDLGNLETALFHLWYIRPEARDFIDMNFG